MCLSCIVSEHNKKTTSKQMKIGRGTQVTQQSLPKTPFYSSITCPYEAPKISLNKTAIYT